MNIILSLAILYILVFITGFSIANLFFHRKIGKILERYKKKADEIHKWSIEGKSIEEKIEQERKLNRFVGENDIIGELLENKFIH